ncbi:SDR family NAD(P)-dependent oxidoreductase [Ruminococcaceae bacterium OttesenSCG-928-L11]|nr:SDR family NAD(P)-dependent oxidoreductase [Ruminococcaceae bacterium OttesenSCG-928-L11]
MSAFDKKVIIAGAGDTLGSQLTEQFLAMGWKVFAGYCAGDERREPTDALVPFGFDPMDHFYTMAAQKKVGEPVDMLIVNVDKAFDGEDATIEGDINYETLIAAYEYNCVGALRVVNTFMPLLEEGTGKRICIVTTKASSNFSCYDTAGFAAHVSRAPLNMACTQLFNGLRPKGYTFRLYCKDVENGNDGWAAEYFTRNRSYEPEDLKHSDEERIVLRDWMAREVPW